MILRNNLKLPSMQSHFCPYLTLILQESQVYGFLQVAQFKEQG